MRSVMLEIGFPKPKAGKRSAMLHPIADAAAVARIRSPHVEFCIARLPRQRFQIPPATSAMCLAPM